MNSSDEEAILKDMKHASLDVLRKTARDVFHEKIRTSNINKKTDHEGNNNNNNVVNATSHKIDDILIPKIDEQDLTIGRILGRGAFCVVRECGFCSTLSPNIITSTSVDIPCSTGKARKKSAVRKSIYFGYASKLIGKQRIATKYNNRTKTNITTAPNNNVNNVNNDEIISGTSSSSTGSGIGVDKHYTFMSFPDSRIRRGNNKKGRTRYVMKQLSSELKRSDKINFLKGTVDLAMETRFLSTLQHNNIISLEGISRNGAFSGGYFIILERLDETMKRRIKSWMDVDRQCKGITGIFTGSKKKAHKLKLERISSACDLTAAMEFLHRKNVVFRDLKPDNVGFDSNGVLKIFDFGLAKELRDDERLDDDLYKMTGCTGSIRYMSPENLQGKPYNLSTDVYSWAMIMWNILALEPPFVMYTESMIIDRVCNRGYRPKLFVTWSSRMSTIIGRSWSENKKDRPSFAEISIELRIELNEIIAAKETGT